jgi:2-polyprenyl-6-methoxyphenol hydroxylase-like FAD-dependent oxidoreductase
MRTALLIVAGVVGLSTAVLYHHLALARAVVEAKAQGYEMGTKQALSISPPSERLEMVCAGLWFGETGKEWQKRGLR